MQADVELKLVHDGKHWVGCNDNLSAKGETLSELDEELKRELRASAEFPREGLITVFMGFDFDTMPVWLRQYHAHYFNRRITVEL
ncbi:MAG: hypothetical protein GY862_22005 [Gammaproteobacteria bacterium]|nr:hypothetical protein [Gammaproteobacteria bacterium]